LDFLWKYQTRAMQTLIVRIDHKTSSDVEEEIQSGRRLLFLNSIGTMGKFRLPKSDLTDSKMMERIATADIV